MGVRPAFVDVRDSNLDIVRLLLPAHTVFLGLERNDMALEIVARAVKNVFQIVRHTLQQTIDRGDRGRRG